jgi:hypothetical protein
METRSLFSWFELVRQRVETTGWSCRRKKKGWERREERGERTQCLLFNNQRVSTVFPYELGNTVETQWRRLNIGLLLWGCFYDFFSFFP